MVGDAQPSRGCGFWLAEMLKPEASTSLFSSEMPPSELFCVTLQNHRRDFY
jgi:hypothetical protein